MSLETNTFSTKLRIEVFTPERSEISHCHHKAAYLMPADELQDGRWLTSQLGNCTDISKTGQRRHCYRQNYTSHPHRSLR